MSFRFAELAMSRRCSQSRRWRNCRVYLWQGGEVSQDTFFSLNITCHAKGCMYLHLNTCPCHSTTDAAIFQCQERSLSEVTCLLGVLMKQKWNAAVWPARRNDRPTFHLWLACGTQQLCNGGAHWLLMRNALEWSKPTISFVLPLHTLQIYNPWLNTDTHYMTRETNTKHDTLH